MLQIAADGCFNWQSMNGNVVWKPEQNGAIHWPMDQAVAFRRPLGSMSSQLDQWDQWDRIGQVGNDMVGGWGGGWGRIFAEEIEWSQK